MHCCSSHLCLCWTGDLSPSGNWDRLLKPRIVIENGCMDDFVVFSVCCILF